MKAAGVEMTVYIPKKESGQLGELGSGQRLCLQGSSGIQFRWGPGQMGAGVSYCLKENRAPDLGCFLWE